MIAYTVWTWETSSTTTILRNKLYHEAPVLSADAKDVDAYMQVAKLLMKNLFDKEVATRIGGTVPTARGRFLVVWPELLDLIFSESYEIRPKKAGEGRSLQVALDVLMTSGVISLDAKSQLEAVSVRRNDIAHGTKEIPEAELNQIVYDLYNLIGDLQAGRHTGQLFLSQGERDILIESLPNGAIHVITASQIPSGWVRAGKRDFMDPDDPAFATQYREDLETLVQKGLAKHHSGILFMLTSEGFKTARHIKEHGRDA